jgi:hypothetical protein
MNIALSGILIVTALCLIAIYGTSLIGFVVIPAFIFIGILVVIAGNHSD